MSLRAVRRVRTGWVRPSIPAGVAVGLLVATLITGPVSWAGVASPPDLTVTLADSPDPVPAGNALGYTITVRNAGTEPAAGVTVSMAVPDGTVFTGFEAPAGWTSTTPPAGGTGTVTASTPASIGAGPVVFRLAVTVRPGTGHGATVNASATVAALLDANPGNNSATTATAVTNAANLGLTVTDAPDPVRPGGTISYAVTVTNAGPVAASAVQVSLPIPASTVLSSFTAPAGWSGNAPPVGGTGTVTATVDRMGVGPATFALTVTVHPDTASGAALTLSATVASTTMDPDRSNNTVSAATTVANAANLAMTVTASPDRVAAGRIVLYTVNLTNQGPVAADTVALTMPIPGATAFSSFAAPPGWSVTTPPVGGAGVVSVTTPGLANAATASFALAVLVDEQAGQGATIRLDAAVTTAVPDPDATNNTASATSTVDRTTSSGEPTRIGSGPLPGGATPMARMLGITVVFVGFGLLLLVIARSRRRG